MKIVAGLGNPGFRYRRTRHNAGYLALKVLSQKYRIGIRKKGFNGIYGLGRIEGQEVMLFEPLTYVNLSGEAVSAVCSSKLDSMDELLVVSDDVNLPLGSIRLRESGSPGGHNGLKSIVDKMGPDFARLRIGIGTDREIPDMSSYVLSPFPRPERGILEEALERAAECVEIWLKTGVKEAMSRCNR